MSYTECLNLELSLQSSHSPCTVDSSEFVCRALFTPNHVKNGKIQSAAFEQILSPDGMSVLRKEIEFHSSLEDTKKIMNFKGREYIKCVFANVGTIREIMCDEYRLIYVIDTSRENIIGHADLISTRKFVSCSLEPGTLNLYIRRQVAKVFNAD